MLVIGVEEAYTGKLVDGGVLEETEFGVGDTGTRNDLDIDLDALAGIGHLLIGLRGIGVLLCRSREQLHTSHDPEQTLRLAGAASFTQPAPEFGQAEGGVPAAHVPD